MCAARLLHCTAACTAPQHRPCLQDHQYRYICDLRKGASDSLVELEMVQHPRDAPRGERVPEGLPFYAIKAHMRELNVRIRFCTDLSSRGAQD